MATKTAKPPQAKPHDQKAFRIELKEIDGEKGVFEGYGNVFGLVDWYREIVEKGAFKKTLADKASAGKKIVLLWQHDYTQPIGTLEAFEDETGLRVKATLTLGVRAADEAYLLLKSGAIDAMSIGFDVTKDKVDTKTGIRHLIEIRLWEVSLVTFPANEASLVDGVKSGMTRAEFEAMTPDQFEAYNLAVMANFNGGKALDFATVLATANAKQDLWDERWKIEDAFYSTIRGIIDDVSLSNEGKIAAADTSLGQYHVAYLAWFTKAITSGLFTKGIWPDRAKSAEGAETKAGAAISKANLTKIGSALGQCQAAAEILASLVGESEEEPATTGKSNTLTTPTEPIATEAATSGTPAGALSHDGAGKAATPNPEVLALISEMRADTSSHKAASFLSSMKPAL